ncbi:MAG: nucleotidyltransferase family protein [Desulfuromonadales bacterium]|nr:nucleotidyltransferase family protein [Desulfuromonadales bacterium]
MTAARGTSPSPASFSALILCAGRSSRMGEFKPLLSLDGETVIERVIGLFYGVGIGQVVVVLGHEAERILPLIGRFGVDPVINTRHDEGMFSSVQTGVSLLGRGCQAFFILPADIPLVKPETLRTLLDVFRQGDADVCRPSFRGRYGHPPLISTALIPAILDFRGPGGLRALLTCYGDRTVDVAVDDPGILLDLDNREDYERALKTVSG